MEETVMEKTVIFNVVAIFMLVGVVVALICLVIVIAKKYGILALAGGVVLLLIVPSVLLTLTALFLTPRMEQDTESSKTVLAENPPPTTVIAPQSSEVHVTAVADPPPAAWSSADLGDFKASLYPGLVECMAPLAREIGDALESGELMPAVAAEREHENFVFTVYSDDSLRSEETECVQLFVDGLANHFPDARVVADEDAGAASGIKPKKNEFRVNLSVPVRNSKPAAWNPGRSDWYGEVKCHVTALDGTAFAEAKFIEKLWVNEFDQLVSEFPQKQFVVGYSNQLSSSESLARQSAMENAQSQIRVSAFGRINTLIDESNVVDRFAQKLSRPYGDVWREAVLIDLTGAAMQAKVSIAAAQSERSIGIKKGGALTAVLLLLTIVAVCLIGNALTQGYYRRRLGWGGGSLGFVIVLAFIMFLLNIG